MHACMPFSPRSSPSHPFLPFYWTVAICLLAAPTLGSRLPRSPLQKSCEWLVGGWDGGGGRVALKGGAE